MINLSIHDFIQVIHVDLENFLNIEQDIRHNPTSIILGRVFILQVTLSCNLSNWGHFVQT